MMRNAAMKLVVGILRIVYCPFKLLQVKNRISFISRQDDNPSMDITMLVNYIADNYPEIQCKVLAKRLEGAGKISYAFHMLSQMKAIATSRVVILDGYCIIASALNHKSETKIVQMWHALAAIKKFGYQILDKPSGRRSDVAEIMCMHKNYDCVLASSQETGTLFCQAFNTSEDKLRLFALPRVDEILREDRELRASIRKEYNIDNDTEVILYAPTFRKGRKIDVEALNRMAKEEGYRLIVKLHPVFNDGLACADRKYTSYQWLKACDRIITDYSALGIEAVLTGKPVYYYVYDIDEYVEEVGLNINPETEMASASARSIEELRNILKKEYDFNKAREFKEKYVSVSCENCTELLAEYITAMAIGRNANGNN